MSDEVQSFSYETLELTELELKRCGKLYDHVVKGHEDCDGTGVDIEADNKTKSCDCMLMYRWGTAMLIARLPQFHWGVPLSAKVTDDIDMDSALGNFANGGGGVLHVTGIGRTRALTCVGKNSIIAQKRVTYGTADDITDALCNDEPEYVILKDRFRYSEVLLIDDLDRLDKGRNDWRLERFEKFLRKVFDSGVQVLVASKHPEKLKGLMPGVADLLSTRSDDLIIVNVKDSNKHADLSEALVYEKAGS